MTASDTSKTFILKKRIIAGVGIAFYLQFCLPLTATFFYEMYHLTGVDWLYSGYSLFRLTSYYFNQWQYQSVACIGIGAVIILVPCLIQKLRRTQGVV